MNFTIDTADQLKVTDTELSTLLTQVYVDGGYTSADDAVKKFAPSAVRARGHLLAAREPQTSQLAGMVITVPPESPARLLAKHTQAEMHLLAVAPNFRKHGLGNMLIEAAVQRARLLGCTSMLLWTQTSMKPAQRLYHAHGFQHIDNLNMNGRDFLVYEKDLRH